MLPITIRSDYLQYVTLCNTNNLLETSPEIPDNPICTSCKLTPTTKRAARQNFTKQCMGPDSKSCFSLQRSVFVKMFQRWEKKRSFFFTTVQKLFFSGKIPCVQISKNHFGRCHKGLHKEMAQKVASSTRQVVFYRYSSSPGKILQREVINEELSMPSPQHQIWCVHFVIEFSSNKVHCMSSGFHY